MFSAVAAVDTSSPPGLGPGAYESHNYNSLQQQMAKEVAMTSRQNPGFGIAGPSHKLPHEQTVEDDKELPGPGKYETNTSRISEASGHSSSFKPPIERAKNKNRYAAADDGLPARPTSGKGGKKGAKKGKEGA